MMLKALALMAVLAVPSEGKSQSRWSRQISSYTSDISDWMPLSRPVERELPQIRRQAVAEPRILTEPFPGFVKPSGFNQDTFPSRAFYNPPASRQLYLQSVPTAPQNYLSEQGFNQGLRFGLAQPSFPLSQGFIAPQFNFENIPQIKPRPQIISNTVKFENSPSKANPVTSPIRSYTNQAGKATTKYVDGYRVENSSDLTLTKKPQSLHKIRFELTDNSKEAFGSPKTKVEREEVQLLYVPLESLNRGQFNFRSPLTSPQVLNTELYNQRPLLQNLVEQQPPIRQPMHSFNSQEYLTNLNSQLHEDDHLSKLSSITTPFSTTVSTTSKPKKLKPHQPPLAIFLTHDTKKEDQVKVGDVLHSLKNANTVAVLDSVNSLNAPKVFIGPSTLSTPENYVKFELPYLSNIENIDKKLRQLPFFVAPLSYNTPQGFAKIPFPSPHVGSVVINSLIKDTLSINNPMISDVYTNPNLRLIPNKEQKSTTQKAAISYYSTSSPPINSPTYEQNYYSIEPQAVRTLRPLKESESQLPITQSTPYKAESYFLNNLGNQYNPTQIINSPLETNNKPMHSKIQNIFKIETTETPKTTVTTKLPATYPSQLLETHNPYSINQAFHFSTPLDYHNFFDEYKETYGKLDTVTPSSPLPSVSFTPTSVTEKEKTEKSKSIMQPQQLPLNYLQNYTPEIHHESAIPSLSYPDYNKNVYFTKTTPTATEYAISKSPANPDDINKPITNSSPAQEHTGILQTQTALFDNYTAENDLPETSEDIQIKNSSTENKQYDTVHKQQEILYSTSSTTTSTRRPPIRTRGRTRYPIAKSESHEYSTRASITRRPLSDRKPLPSRSRYEQNKVTTEITTIKLLDTSESTTKLSRTRTRGRIHYRPSDTDDSYAKRNKLNSKENDLAYQRDILHQNYPVTLMERASTVDIEAITEPSDKKVATNNVEIPRADDTQDAYSHDKLSITEPIHSDFKDTPEQYTTIHSLSDSSYVPKEHDHNIDYGYEPVSNTESPDSISSHDEMNKDGYLIKTTPEQSLNVEDGVFVTTEAYSPTIKSNNPTNLGNSELEFNNQEEIKSSSNSKLDAKIADHESSPEQEENIVETTPSYNRVRVRPGVIRQYYQSSSTDASKSNRKKPTQAVTYRPAFDRRRTTMRIEEIEADLKTKQVHVRPDFQDYRQPVYKPEPSNEFPTPASTTETSAKRGQLRRRRPGYAATEATITRKPHEVKNRYRGRRPTEKPTDRPTIQTENTTTTVKNVLYNRYSHRPRLSERYNRKPEINDQESEDQDSNYSINRPKYTAPDSERWSAKISVDSFKPYNPNNIADDTKIITENNVKSKDEQLDIITAKNEYEDILISVTPAYNSIVNKRIPDIPPTLEALVEQSKVTKSDSTDTMSTFETMLEEVMKSLEEQDEHEYTSNVMKHKGGEIGEIPPEKIISSEENYSLKSTTPLQEEPTTLLPNNSLFTNATEEVPSLKNRRRGFWKKVKVRPVTEAIDVAESQYYPHVVNRLGQYVSKSTYQAIGKGNSKAAVTTYKPNYQFLKDFFETDEDTLDMIPNIDIPKITTSNIEHITETMEDNVVSTKKSESVTEKMYPGDIDLGTGAPDPTYDDTAYYSEPTEPATNVSDIDRSDGFSLIDYFFGVTSSDNSKYVKNNTLKSGKSINTTTELSKLSVLEDDIKVTKLKPTTENSYVPEEMTAETVSDNYEIVTEVATELHNKEIREFIDKSNNKVESTSITSYMDPANVVSTSISTEVSHETEICFRGKCIKTNKDIL